MCIFAVTIWNRYRQGRWIGVKETVVFDSVDEQSDRECQSFINMPYTRYFHPILSSYDEIGDA